MERTEQAADDGGWQTAEHTGMRWQLQLLHACYPGRGLRMISCGTPLSPTAYSVYNILVAWTELLMKKPWLRHAAIHCGAEHFVLVHRTTIHRYKHGVTSTHSS